MLDGCIAVQWARHASQLDAHATPTPVPRADAWQVYMANLAMDATDDHIRDFCEKMGQVRVGQGSSGF